MMIQYDRDGWIQIGDKAFKGLHFRFKVKKSLDAECNSADVHIFNLAPDTRKEFGSIDPAQGAKVVFGVFGGYRGSVKMLFKGDAITIDHVKQGADWVTHITSGDGVEQAKDSFSSESFGPGASLTGIISKLGGALKIGTKDAVESLNRGKVVPKYSKYNHGYTVHGRTVRELDRVTQGAGLHWSIQDGALRIMEKGKTTGRLDYPLSEETGLIGSPDHGKPSRDDTKSYLRVKALLNGDFFCGAALHLITEHLDGMYRIERIEHQGELDGQSWYSNLDLIPM